ncbi:hypothetical protein B0H11DRAFT_2274768 [Mycena galericulata]|nr:hypothetical protein B0H11DRAFT_2274768 [Mycena galericulata]
MAMPPTSHELPQTHRAHLIRSTRKLGALLGETPLLVDAAPGRSHTPSSSVSSTSSTDSRRSGRVFEPAPRSSSLASVDPNERPASRARAAPGPRPLLYLQLAGPSRPTSVAAPSPLTSGFTPITPTFPPIDRRKKMAKLVRTLGTNVPPELVFSAPDKRAKRPRDPSEYLPSPVLVPALLAALGPAHSRGSTLGPGPPSPNGSMLASPTREAGRMLHADAPWGGRGNTGSSRAGSVPPSPTSPTDEWISIPAPAPLSSSYPPTPRSPHYIKRSELYAAERERARERARERERALSPLPTPTPTPARTRSPPARPSQTTRSTPDARYLSRHIVIAPPPTGRSSGESYDESYAPSSSYAYDESGDDEQADADESRGSYDEQGDADMQTAGAGEAPTHRSERATQGWSGEWRLSGVNPARPGTGPGGMEEVVRSLRALRFK